MTWISANGGPAPFVSPDRNFSADEIATQEREFRFGDLIDMVNPLQHLPVIGTIYRSLTGDTLDGPARIIGGLIYGGPVGMASAIGNAILEEHTGRDLNDTVVAAIFGDDEGQGSAPPSDLAARPDPAAESTGEPPVQAAQAQSTPAPSAQAQAQAQASTPAPTPASAGGGADEPLSGLDALRAFARDSGLVSGAAAAPAQMPAPTTAASTSGQASTRQAAVDEESAEAALQAAAARPRGTESEQWGAPQRIAAVAGGPPPAERFMPLGARAFGGPMTVSASRGGIALPTAEASGGFGLSNAALAGDGDYRPRPGVATSGDQSVSDQMMEALLKYQALRESRGDT